MSKCQIMSMTLIHYGDDAFSMDKFVPVTEWNDAWFKPKGGLWTSPANSKYGWKHWCKSEDFAPMRGLSKSFKLNYTGNTVVINTEEDLNKLHWQQRQFGIYPAWEPLKEDGVDAVFLTESGQWATRLSMPKNLYGWDCETVFIINPHSVCEVPKMRFKLIKKKQKTS